MIYDILVVGSGPAGLASGMEAGRLGVNVLVVEEESVGGELVNRHTIKNLPGVSEMSGTELRSRLVGQLEEYDVSIAFTEVEDIIDDDLFEVRTTDGMYRARTIIVAGGGQPTRLSVPGAEQYIGRGVFYCAMCDGPLYTDDVVAVSGSDDWALTDALFLSKYASKVIVIEKGKRVAASKSLSERVTSHPTIEIRTQTLIKAVHGDDLLRQLELIDTADRTEHTEDVEGLYVQHGINLNSTYLTDILSTTERGKIVVDQALETDVRGIFAAGDIRQSSARTIASTIGDGITASHSAARQLQQDK